MDKSDDRGLNYGSNNDSGIASDRVSSNYSTEHVPAPAPHVPDVELHVADDGARWRLEEAGTQGAWIEFDPVGAV